MLPKYFTSIWRFYLISPESRDLLGFYCRASIVYNIMLLTLTLTPSFSSPILEKNKVGVRNDTFTCTATSSQLINKKIQVKKSKSYTNFAFKTVLWFFKTLTLFFYSFKIRNKIGRFGKLLLFTELALPSWLRYLLYNGVDSLPLLEKFWSLLPLDQWSDEACLIFPTVSQLALVG